jgi:hypothetical protein
VVTPLFVPDASTTTIVDRIRLSAADQRDKGHEP